MLAEPQEIIRRSRKSIGKEGIDALQILDSQLDDGMLHELLTSLNSVQLGAIETINLTGTDISDQSYKLFSLMPNLKKINLTNTRVGNETFEFCLSLPNCEELYLGFTKVTAVPHVVGSNVRVLSLSGNSQLEFSSLMHLRALRLLTVLDLSSTQFCATWCPALSGITKLECLEVDFDKIDLADSLLAEIAANHSSAKAEPLLFSLPSEPDSDVGSVVSVEGDGVGQALSDGLSSEGTDPDVGIK